MTLMSHIVVNLVEEVDLTGEHTSVMNSASRSVGDKNTSRVVKTIMKRPIIS